MARSILIERFTGQSLLALMDGGQPLEVRVVRDHAGPVAFSTHLARVGDTAPGGMGWFLQTEAGPMFLPRDRARRSLDKDPVEGQAIPVRVMREAIGRDGKTAVAEPLGNTAPLPASAPAEAGRILHWHGQQSLGAIVSNDRELLAGLKPLLPEGVAISHADRPLDLPAIEEALAVARTGQHPLASGGSLTIEEGRTLTDIDVNSAASDPGRDARKASQQANLEAAQAIPHLMRLLGLGGLLVADFIPAGGASHRRAVEAAFQQAMAGDPAHPDGTGLSKFWLLQAERRRRSASLCTLLAATSLESEALAALRHMEREAATGHRPALADLARDIQDWLRQHPALLQQFAARTGHPLQS